MLRKAEILQYIDTSFLWYFTAINLVYLVVMILGSFKALKRKKELYFEDYTNILQSNTLPALSFIVPAYNEEKNILENIDNLLNLSYPHKQIIIVNDGSSDHTLELLHKKLSLHPVPKFYDDAIVTQQIQKVFISKKKPESLVIDKANGGGKFDALNAGINATQTPFYVAIDADTIIDDKAFLSLLRPLFSDPNIIAIGASVKIRNGCQLDHNKISTSTFPKNIFPVMETMEYLRSFLERQGWDYVGGNFVLAGAFGIFRTEEIIKVGGYVNTVAEDMEIIIRLHRVMKDRNIPYRIKYLPDPVAWTVAPEKIGSLSKQRSKWHRGLLDCLYFHKKALFNPKYGIFGAFVYPFWIWGEALEPFVELLGMIYIIAGFFLGAVHIHFVLLFVIVTWGFTTIFTAHCILVEEFFFQKYPRIRSMIYLIVLNAFENVGYRQMNVFWRLHGCLSFIKNFSSVRSITKQVERMVKKGSKAPQS
jgi:cellulose synthase/poly-beta-1,6-N-acetylglucosamine synthase-like glycosyltransferase